MSNSAYKDLVAKARSYRRFKEDLPVGADLLTDIVDTARLVPSVRNAQPLRYAVSASKGMNERIFPHLQWAAALKDWPGPMEGERPTGYIIIGCASAVVKISRTDLGIAAQTVQLGLADQGIACCMLANINAEVIHELIGFPDDISVMLVIAVGYPGETVLLEPLPADGNPSYWHDTEGRHHVPKRALKDILLKTFS